MGLFNNSREIINGYKSKFHERPSGHLQEKLEGFGETVDFGWQDHEIGEEFWNQHREYANSLGLEEIRYDEVSDEELGELLNENI